MIFGQGGDMKTRIVKGIVAFGLLSLARPLPAATELERQVLAALNAARKDPAAYAAGLKQYRTYFRANLLHYPGQEADIETQEGVKVVDETIDFLAHRAPLQPVEESVPLGSVAGDLVADQSHSGDTGHQASDGTSPSERSRRHGGGPEVAEVIAYGPIDAADVVRQLIVDDGVADRGHRAIIYSPELRFAGVACGPHPEYRTMCVIDLAVTPDGRPSGRGARTAAR
jgi:uncharacterized protein YkwD